MSLRYSVIGDNTPENREWLEKVGYGLVVNSELDKYICVFHDSSYAVGGNFIPDYFYHKAISCIGNPHLFRSVTAMRDDSDYMQWFTDGNIRVCRNQSDFRYEVSIPSNIVKDVHKATLSELQEHFQRV